MHYKDLVLFTQYAGVQAGMQPWYEMCVNMCSTPMGRPCCQAEVQNAHIHTGMTSQQQVTDLSEATTHADYPCMHGPGILVIKQCTHVLALRTRQ
jgi:hypothetical protein